MFNRGAYTTIVAVCKKIVIHHLNGASYHSHTHAGIEYVKRAGALYTHRVYRGCILHCFHYAEQTGIHVCLV